MPQAILLLPGVGAQGGEARRPRAARSRAARRARSSTRRARSSTPSANPASDFRAAAGAEAARLAQRGLGRLRAGSADAGRSWRAVRRARSRSCSPRRSRSLLVRAELRHHGQPERRRRPTRAPRSRRPAASRPSASTSCGPATRSMRSPRKRRCRSATLLTAEPERRARPRSSSARSSACDEMAARSRCCGLSSSPQAAAAAKPARRRTRRRPRLARREHRHRRGARLPRRATWSADRVDHEADDGDRRARAPEARREVVTRRPAGRRRRSGVDLPRRRASRSPSHDLVKGALIQSANDAADALALATAPSFPAFAELMNAKAQRARAAPTSHFVRPDGLDAPGEYSSARDVTQARARRDADPDRPRRRCDERDRTIEDGRATLHTWNDLLGVVPGRLRRQDRPHLGSRLVPGRGASAATGRRSTPTILGSPSEAQRDADLETLLAYGLAQYRAVDAVATGRDYADVGLPYGRGAARPRRARLAARVVVRVGGRCTERVVAPRGRLAAGRAPAQVLGQRPGLVGADGWSASARSSPPRSVARAGPRGAAYGWYARRTVHDLVCAAPRDRHRHAQRGLRRARSPCRTSSAGSATARAPGCRSPAARGSTSRGR